MGNNSKNKKFTLIELLVVVAIIGILVSILLPSLARARETSKTAVCKSNSRQIGLAFASYHTDYDGVMAQAGYGFANLLGHEDYLNAPRVEAFDNSTLDKTLERRSVFFCPTGRIDRISKHAISGNWNFIDIPETQRPWRSGNHSFGGSGGFDVWSGIVGTHTADNASNSNWRMNNWRVNGVNDIWPTIGPLDNPTRSLMLHDGTHHMNTWTGTGGRLSARHGGEKLTNALFYDGHAQTYSFTVLNSTKLKDGDSDSEVVWRGSVK